MSNLNIVLAQISAMQQEIATLRGTINNQNGVIMELEQCMTAYKSRSDTGAITVPQREPRIADPEWFTGD